MQRREMTIGERLQPTIDAATEERDKAVKRAKMTGYSLNVAIAVQVILGALTTGLGAALSGKSSSVAISILGGASTLAASYLARTRGSNEPEFSLLRAKALNQFLREIHAFKLDHGHEVGHAFDERVDGFRFGLENMLGNPAASVTVTDETAVGPRRDDGPGLGTFGPAGLGVGGGVGVGIGPGVGILVPPQQQQQQHPAGKAQGMTSPTFGIGAPPLTLIGTPQNQGVSEKASLAHSSMV
ncbi:hypothetical protein BJV78DRAFT_1133658 [Lactifluus subvellereus]|nr:hypothetical protein BJV78DRAFT_1133658 [Lactifluus subvellereus]